MGSVLGFGLHRLEIYHSSVQRQTGPVHSLQTYNAEVKRGTRSDGDPALAGTEIPERGQMEGVGVGCGGCVCGGGGGGRWRGQENYN